MKQLRHAIIGLALTTTIGCSIENPIKDNESIPDIAVDNFDKKEARVLSLFEREVSSNGITQRWTNNESGILIDFPDAVGEPWIAVWLIDNQPIHYIGKNFTKNSSPHKDYDQGIETPWDRSVKIDELETELRLVVNHSDSVGLMKRVQDDIYSLIKDSEIDLLDLKWKTDKKRNTAKLKCYYRVFKGVN